jgi:hypothetical protein
MVRLRMANAVRTLLRHENIVTTSDVYGDMGLDAKRRIQQRMVEFVRRQASDEASKQEAVYHSLTSRDPYLPQILLADFPEVQERNGSSGRTRTYNPPVNSRMLCH